MTPDELDEFFVGRNPYGNPHFAHSDDPHCIYFYYIVPNPSDPTNPQVRVFYHDEHKTMTWGRVKKVITGIAQIAAAHDDFPAAIGNSLPAAKWRRKSYLVFLIDSDADEFAPGQAVAFSWRGMGGNHTFFKGRDWKVDLSSTKRRRSAFACINYFRKNDGTPWHDGDEETFDLSFVLGGQIPFRRIDDGNTNLGPPVPPPA